MQREEAVLSQYKILGKQLQISPLNALLSLLYEAAGNVQYYRGRIETLKDIVYESGSEQHGWKEETKKLVELYNEERDRLEKYTLDGLRINLEAKQVQLYEMQATAIDNMANAMMEGLNLKSADRLKASQIMASELRKYAEAQKEDSRWQGPFMAADEIEFDEDSVIDMEAKAL